MLWKCLGAKNVGRFQGQFGKIWNVTYMQFSRDLIEGTWDLTLQERAQIQLIQRKEGLQKKICCGVAQNARCPSIITEAGRRKRQACLVAHMASSEPCQGSEASYSTRTDRWDLLHDQTRGQCTGPALLKQQWHLEVCLSSGWSASNLSLEIHQASVQGAKSQDAEIGRKVSSSVGWSCYEARKVVGGVLKWEWKKFWNSEKGSWRCNTYMGIKFEQFLWVLFLEEDF